MPPRRTSRRNPPLDELIAKWVGEPYRVDATDRRALKRRILASTTDAGPLERIEREDPKWREGDVVELDVTSFSSVRFSESKSAGHITWKSRDKAIITVERPRRGLTIDYDTIGNVGFNAAAERETLLAGPYRVVAVERIVEPFTAPQYGYRVPLYTLREIR